MRVLCAVHQPDAGPGVFAEAAAARGDELVEWSPSEEAAPALDGVGAAIFLGGAMHADQEEAHPWLRDEKRLLRGLLEAGVPTLGVCLGAQLLAEAAGASPRRAPEPEIGWREVTLDPAAAGDPLLGPLPGRFHAFQWHSYEAPLPAGATALAHSPLCLQAYRAAEAAWGVQFHAEVTDATVRGWLADYRRDEDAVRAGIDPEAIAAETERRIEAWNELGGDLCDRFLGLAATRA